MTFINSYIKLIKDYINYRKFTIDYINIINESMYIIYFSRDITNYFIEIYND